TLRADRPSGQTVTSWPNRGSSERMNSCSDSSSSTNRTRRLLCGGVAKSFLRLFRAGYCGLAHPAGDRQDVGPPQCIDLRARAVRDLGRLDWNADRKGAPLVRTGAGGVDLAAVLVDDLVANEQAQTRALAGAAAREERLEDVAQHVGCHAAAGVHKQEF